MTNFSVKVNSVFNLDEVIRLIQDYYPLKKSYEFEANPNGYKQYEEQFKEKLHDPKIFKETWSEFEQNLANQLNLEFKKNTGGRYPCYSTDFILNKINISNYQITEYVSLYVSILGPYFTIAGEVRVENYYNNQKKWVNTSCLLSYCPSPKHDFEEPFLSILNHVQDNFDNYIFIPFEIGIIKFKELKVYHLEEKGCTINQALFSDAIPSSRNNVIPTDRFQLSNWLR